jgi:hypothetical protein
LADDNDIEACLMCGRAHQEGIGTPVDGVVALSYFQRAASLGDSRGQNSVGKCLETGIGTDVDPSQAVMYYQMAAARGNADGANNYGLALESGEVLPENAIQAAKYYRFASDHGHADGANNYGLCLERGYGVKRDLRSAAEYYRLAADRGHADGMNNFGFCLEHGIGVEVAVDDARRYYSKAMKLGHAEAALNHRRCCRLLGDWEIPRRSGTQETLSEDFAKGIHRPDNFFPLLRAQPVEQKGTLVPTQAVKTLRWTDDLAGWITRLAPLKHPCVVSMLAFARSPGPDYERVSIQTERMQNGDLRENFGRLRSPTKLSKIIAGVVLGMRFMHSNDIVHGHLKPSNLLLDLEWRVKIADFGSSKFAHGQQGLARLIPGVAHFLAPERFDMEPPSIAGDVYSFGLILYELIVGKPAFSPDWRPEVVMGEMLGGWSPDLPGEIEPELAMLIQRCCSRDCDERPSFGEILEILRRLQYRILEGVRSHKVARFVADIEAWEAKRSVFVNGKTNRIR